MVFTEQKTDKGFLYKVEDVFGEMEFESPDQLEPQILDQLFLAIFNVKSNTEIIEGDIRGSSVRYKFKKAKQWDKLDEEELIKEIEQGKQLKRFGMGIEKSTGYPVKPTPYFKPTSVKPNLFNTIKQWLLKLKKSLRKFIA